MSSFTKGLFVEPLIPNQAPISLDATLEATRILDLSYKWSKAFDDPREKGTIRILLGLKRTAPSEAVEAKIRNELRAVLRKGAGLTRNSPVSEVADELSLQPDATAGKVLRRFFTRVGESFRSHMANNEKALAAHVIYQAAGGSLAVFTWKYLSDKKR